MKSNLVVILMVLLVLGGFAAPIIHHFMNPPIREGYVIQKWHEDASTTTTLLPIVMYNGSTTTTIMVPHTIYDDEDWCIKIENIVDEKRKTRVLYVSSSIYQSLKVGDFFSLDITPANVDDPDVKRRN